MDGLAAVYDAVAAASDSHYAIDLDSAHVRPRRPGGHSTIQRPETDNHSGVHVSPHTLIPHSVADLSSISYYNRSSPTAAVQHRLTCHNLRRNMSASERAGLEYDPHGSGRNRLGSDSGPTRVSWLRWGVLVAVLGLLVAVVPAAVLAQSSSTTQLYGRVADKDIDVSADVDWPRGVWGDGSTIWVAQTSDDKLYAYSVTAGDSFGTRLSSKDIDISATSDSPRGIWSDGTYMYVANEYNMAWDDDTANVVAYQLSDGSQVSDRSFALHLNNNDPRGMWSDGTTLWVLQPVGNTANSAAGSKVFAYTLASGARDSSKDINSLPGGLSYPTGLWSDGTTIWTTAWATEARGDARTFAFDLSSGSRDRNKEFNLDSDNDAPSGLWSDGTTLWVTDVYEDKFFAHSMIGTQTGGL